MLLLPYRKLVVPALLVLLISWLFSNSFEEKKANLKKHQIVLLFILPFIFYLVGMLYSSNQSFGWKDIETKLALLVFPLIYSSGKSLYAKHRLLAMCFIFSMGICSILSIVIGAFKYGRIPFYEMMDVFLHPSYLAMYLNLAFAFAIILFYAQMKTGYTVFLVASSICISTGVWLSQSKSGILIWVLLMMATICYNLFFRKRFIGLSLAIVAAAISFGFFSYYQLPGFKERFTYAITSVFSTDEKVDPSTTESSHVRMLIWEQALKLIEENPLLGAGTGDIKDELYVKYEQAGMTGALQGKLNVHNQYLQVFATLGLFGFTAFLLSILLPLYLSLRNRNFYYLAIFLVFGINVLFESMLERQDGVIFFAFFNSLLFFHFYKGNEIHNSGKLSKNEELQ